MNFLSLHIFHNIQTSFVHNYQLTFQIESVSILLFNNCYSYIPCQLSFSVTRFFMFNILFIIPRSPQCYNLSRCLCETNSMSPTNNIAVIMPAAIAEFSHLFPSHGTTLLKMLQNGHVVWSEPFWTNEFDLKYLFYHLFSYK